MDADARFPLHDRSEVLLAADAARLFAHLDDHRRLSSHMEKRSLMTAGASMRIETDDSNGQAVGSVIRMTGRVLGMQLSLAEIVPAYEPPQRKAWETVGEPQLLVIGGYRMGFEINPVPDGSRLVVFIDYRLPAKGLSLLLGRVLGGAYAAWCTRRMAEDARAVFGVPNPTSNGRPLDEDRQD